MIQKPQTRAGHAIFITSNKLYLYGGFGGEGGYTNRTDMFYLDLENPTKWHLVDVQEGSTLPGTGRPLSGVVMDDKFYIFGGYDGKKPQGKLICFHHSFNIWHPVDIAFSMADEVEKVPMSSYQWYDPTPRYGHSTVVDKKIITICAGSGSLFLDDVFQIDVEEEQ